MDIVNILVMWAAFLSGPQGLQAQYVANYDADTVTFAFACKQDVKMSVNFTGVEVPGVSALDMGPATKTLPCRQGRIEFKVRLLGIDAPEMGSAKCDQERESSKRGKAMVANLLRSASVIRLKQVDTESEKWGRVLASVEATVGGKPLDIATTLLQEPALPGYPPLALPYRDGIRWCP